jgi:hypothetical protein
MIRINVEEVLNRAQEEAQKPKPLPKILIATANRSYIADLDDVKAVVIEEVKGNFASLPDVLKPMWAEYSAALVERNRLSTQIAHLVENGATQDELREQYEKIESYRPQLQDLYKKIQDAERGKLPEEPTPTQPKTLAELKLEKEALIDRRSKLKKKIAAKVAMNPAKYVEWEMDLAKANMEFQAIIEHIKVIEGKA